MKAYNLLFLLFIISIVGVLCSTFFNPKYPDNYFPPIGFAINIGDLAPSSPQAEPILLSTESRYANLDAVTLGDGMGIIPHPGFACTGSGPCEGQNSRCVNSVCECLQGRWGALCSEYPTWASYPVKEPPLLPGPFYSGQEMPFRLFFTCTLSALINIEYLPDMDVPSVSYPVSLTGPPVAPEIISMQIPWFMPSGNNSSFRTTFLGTPKFVYSAPFVTYSRNWKVTSGPCAPVPCGPSTNTRVVKCISVQNGVDVELADSYCENVPGGKPASVGTCQIEPDCHIYQWVTQPKLNIYYMNNCIGTCDLSSELSPEELVQIPNYNRVVSYSTCWDRTVQQFIYTTPANPDPRTFCDMAKKPPDASTTQCEMEPCDWSELWMYGPWSTCSKACGPGGFQTRNGKCLVRQSGFGAFEGYSCTSSTYVGTRPCFGWMGCPAPYHGPIDDIPAIPCPCEVPCAGT